MSALERIVEELASRELTILRPGEDTLLALITIYSQLTDNDVLRKIIEEIKTNRIDVHGRRRMDLVNVAQALRIFIQSRGGRTRIITDKELERMGEI